MIPQDHALVPTTEKQLPDARPAEQQAPQKQAAVPPPPRRRLLLYVGIPLVALLAWGAWGHWRTHAAAAETQQQQRDFTPDVRTAKATKVATPIELTEPGQTEAFDTANLYARATGYVAERRVDIGSRVHKGDLLLRIAAPDLDQQLVQAQAQVGQNEAALLQAQASLKQAQANVKLSNVTKFRETTLAAQGWETRQNADNSTAQDAVNVAAVSGAQAGIAVAAANLRAQQATVERLQALIGFELVTAPFDGVVTARNVDTGDLLTADNGTGTPLFSLARDDVLRVAVYVPQAAAVGVREGLEAKVTVPELPGRTFNAHVSRTAHALDINSRALLTEVDVDNADGLLRPGLYASVSVSIPRDHPAVMVPDESLVFNAGGLQVATVDAGEDVHFRKVSVYRDFGTTVELSDGLRGDETLVLSPPADLQDGGRVHPQAPPNQSKPSNVPQSS